jgi:hypothetical protein
MPDYFRALAKEWSNVLFGETLVGIGFLVWWALGAPTNHALVVVFVIAMFVAGYYAWRAQHLRLITKLEIARAWSEEWMIGENDPHSGHPARRYHLEIVNRSEGVTIEGVSVQLSDIFPQAPNFGFLPIPLHWQHDNPSRAEDQQRSVDLNPCEPRNIDFVSAIRGDNRFSVIHVVAGVNHYIPFDTGGNRLQVRIAAKNMPAFLCWFKVWRDDAGMIVCEVAK